MEQKDIDKMYNELEQEELAIQKHNKELLNSINCNDEDIKDLLADCIITGRMEIVDTPTGEDNNEEFGIFTKVFVDQKTNYPSEDSFYGFIYGEFGHNRWLKVPYEC